MKWSNIKKAFSDFDPFSGISQQIEIEHETFEEKTEREKKLFLEKNKKPKKNWCGCEYVLYVYPQFTFSGLFDWRLQEGHSEVYDNGVLVKYCNVKNKFKKIKYKQVK